MKDHIRDQLSTPERGRRIPAVFPPAAAYHFRIFSDFPFDALEASLYSPLTRHPCPGVPKVRSRGSGCGRPPLLNLFSDNAIQFASIRCFLHRRRRHLFRDTSPFPLDDAARGELLFLHVLEGRVHPSDPVFHPGRLYGGSDDVQGPRPAGTAEVPVVQPGLQPGHPVFLQVFQFPEPLRDRGLPGLEHLLRRPGLPRDAAGGHLVLHLPDPELHHRCLQGPDSGGAAPGDLRPLRGLLAPARGRSHRAHPSSPAPVPGTLHSSTTGG